MPIQRQDLIKLLQEDPTLVEELRAILLSKDLLDLPNRTREEFRELRSILEGLLDTVQRIINTLEILAQRTQQNTELLGENQKLIASLIEQGREHDRRLAELSQQVQENSKQIAALIEQGREHDRRLAELAEQFQRQFELVHQQLQWLRDRFGTMYGQMMEMRYRQNPYGYFSEIVRRAKWVTGDELEDLLSHALEAGRISEDEQRELIRADLIVRGVRQRQTTWLVVEVSGTIETEDVDRALTRSHFLSRCVKDKVLPVVAGEFCAEEVLRNALRKGVWVLLDGRTFSPERTSQ